MKLQQLRCIVAMVRNNLNVSETAVALHTSQPGVSRQIRQLEDELGVVLFERSGRQVTAVTAAGQDIIRVAETVLAGTEDIRSLGRQHGDPHAGDLRLATTHTQARYVLPRIVEAFGASWPRVNIHLHQGTPEQMARMTEAGEVDLVIATEGMHHYENARADAVLALAPDDRRAEGARALQARLDRQPDPRGARELPDRDLRVRLHRALGSSIAPFTRAGSSRTWC